jgi:peptidoglycan/xylan/chitin deacetylase (PgdA/CDA1 family)
MNIHNLMRTKKFIILCMFIIVVLFVLCSELSQLIFSGDQAQKKIALTFDDGPDPIWTPAVLAILAKENVSTTFFLLGDSAQQHPDLVAQIASAGHEVGMHSATHKTFLSLSTSQVEHEVTIPKKNIETITEQRITLFRPPHGIIGPWETWQVRKQNLTITIWSLDSKDWQLLDKDKIVQRVVDHAKPGAIILMHDGGGTTRQPTVDALPDIINQLKNEGYSFVTVSELMDKDQRKDQSTT